MNHNLEKRGLYDVQDVSQILNLGLSTVYKYVAEEELSCIRFGRAIRFSEDDINQFIDLNRSHHNKTDTNNPSEFPDDQS